MCGSGSGSRPQISFYLEKLKIKSLKYTLYLGNLFGRSYVKVACSHGVRLCRQLSVSAHNLKQAWVASRRVSKDDWSEWLRRISIAVLKESPSHALRSVTFLSETFSVRRCQVRRQ